MTDMTDMTDMPNVTRRAEVRRETKETTVALSLTVDGAGTTSVSTGIPFFDHMLEQLGKHAGFDLRVEATGDLDGRQWLVQHLEKEGSRPPEQVDQRTGIGQ